MSRYDRIEAALRRSADALAFRRIVIASGFPDPAFAALMSYRVSTHECATAQDVMRRGGHVDVAAMEARAESAMIAALDAGITWDELDVIDDEAQR